MLAARDNPIASDAATRWRQGPPLANLAPAQSGGERPVYGREAVRDVLPDRAMPNDSAQNRAECRAGNAAGRGGPDRDRQHPACPVPQLRSAPARCISMTTTHGGAG